MTELAVSPEPASPPPVDAVMPIPPRYWWLKRCAVAGLILLAAIAISRWWWGVYASRTFQAEFDRLRAAGEPLDPQDFDLPPVPDELNAALPLKAALAIAAQTRGVSRVAPWPTRRNWAKQQPEDPVAAAARAANVARIRELVHEARLRPAVDWQFTGRSPTAPASLPTISMQYDQIVNLLDEAAFFAHEQGDDEAALDMAEDLLALADHLTAYRTLLTSLFAQVIYDRVQVDMLQTMLMDAHADATATPKPGARPMRREQAIALMNRLLDERALAEGFVWGMQAERSLHYEAIQLVVSGQEPVPFVRRDISSGVRLWLFLVRPMYQLDGVRVLRHANALVELAKADNAQKASRREPHVRPLGMALDWQAHSLSVLCMPNLNGVENKHFEALARRRMTVVALAIHLYECDHGHLPATLDELVPEYLPSIPENPLLDDHSPIQYRLEEGNACLYAPPQTGPPPAGKHMADISWRFKLRAQSTTAPATRPAPKHINRAD